MRALTAAIFFTGVLLGLMIGVATAAPPPELAKMQEQMLGVSAQLNENCSATLVYSDRDQKTGDVTTLFLTAKHCVEGGAKRDMVLDVPVYQKNRVVKKDRYIARLKGQSYKVDLALIELKDKQTFFEASATLADPEDQVYMGEPTWTVGYPESRTLTITQGLLGGLETINFPSDGQEYFRASAAMAGGNSGGGMYHKTVTGDYRLLGVTVVRSRAENFVGYYVTAEQIHEYLKLAAPQVLGVEKTPKTGAGR